MQEAPQEKWLVIQLRPLPRLFFVEREPRATLILNGEQYEALADGDVQLAFDRLTSKGRLVGLLIWVYIDKAWELLRYLRAWTWLRLSHSPRSVEVYFVPYESLSDHEIIGMGDQSLIGQVYANAAGAIAVSVDLSQLLTTESEWAVIPIAERRWANWQAEPDGRDVQ
jgi:hypothetical protein